MANSNLDYGINNKIGNKEVFLAVPSMILGVGILNLPRALSTQLHTSDGWISIILASSITAFFSWVIIKLALTAGDDSILQFTSKTLAKPVGYVLAFLFFIHFFSYCFYETRALANLAKHFLFDRTPVEVIALLFLWLVFYAVSGSRTALIRLNVMFFPIVLLILFMIILFNLREFEFGNIKPMFVTDIPSILKGSYDTIFSFLGFEVLFFYVAMLDKKQSSKNISLYPIIGIGLLTFIYVLVYIFSIAIFTVEGAGALLYPTLELAKVVEFPGGILERLESLFFTVWVMTIFNTTAMSMDIAVYCLQFLIPKVKRITCILIILPLIYISSMLPQNLLQLQQAGEYLGYSGIVVAIIIPSILFILTKVKGGTK